MNRPRGEYDSDDVGRPDQPSGEQFSREGEPYTSYRDYLTDELERADLLVKAYIISRHSLAPSVSPAQLRSESAFTWDDPHVPADCSELWDQLVASATHAEENIVRRLGRTEKELTQQFPLLRVIDQRQLRRRDSVSAARRAGELETILIALLEYRFPSYRAAFNTLAIDDGTVPGALTIGMLTEILRPVLRPHASRPAQSHWLELFREGFINIGDDAIEESRRRLQIDPAVAEFLVEEKLNDLELHGSVDIRDVHVDFPEVLADEEIITQLESLVRQFRNAKLPVVALFHGPAGGPFMTAALAVLTGLHRGPLFVADVAAAVGRPDWSRWVTRVYRNARLERAAVLWYGATAILDASRTDNRWIELLKAPPDVLTFVSADTAWDPVDVASGIAGTFARIEFPVPSLEVRRKIWQHHRVSEPFHIAETQWEATLQQLTSFPFTAGQVAGAVAIARGLSATSKSVEPARWLIDACRRVSSNGLVSFTQRIAPATRLAELDAVVLGPEQKQLLHELDDRIKHMSDLYFGFGYGERLGLSKGLVAMFSGPSGTGKTLAASVLASCNDRDLYKVDMAAVVSKYVGETEKNLARIFSDAQSANALLFFDEADAIFGKRGDVDKAQDRWANMEINFLLQRIEEFAGVVILATNMRQNIDEAFVRRVQVLIEFKNPDEKDRLKILRGMFPPHVTPPSHDDLQAFANQFELSGGNLKNVAVDAAFRALKDHRQNAPLPVRIEHLVYGVAREYRKLSRPVNLASFGRQFYQIIQTGDFQLT